MNEQIQTLKTWNGDISVGRGTPFTEIGAIDPL